MRAPSTLSLGSIPPFADAQPPPTRLATLDGLRGVAILLVMVHHLTIIPTRTSLDAAVKGLLGMGVGVELFFILSGYLITSLLVRSKSASRPEPISFFGRFYLRRALRLFPLYYLVLACLLVLMPRLAAMDASGDTDRLLDRMGWMPGHESAAVWFWLQLSNIPMALRGSFLHESLDITWSLAVQEQFYLVWPLLVYFCTLRRLKWACVGMIIGSLLFRAAAMGWHANPVALYVATPARLDSLAAGSLVAIWQATRPHRLESFERYARAITALSVIALAALIAPRVQSWRGTGIEEIAAIFQHSPAARTLVAAGLAGVLVLVLAANPAGMTSRVLSSRPLTMLGRYSFAMFLLHQPVRACVRHFVLAPIDVPALAGSRLPGQAAFTLVCISITFVAAAASWHLLEKHFLQLPRLGWPTACDQPLAAKGAT